MKKQNNYVLKGITAMGMAICISVITCMTGHAASIERMPAVIDIGENAIRPMAVGADISASLSISSGKATASCKVSGASKKVTKISVTMYLQKKSSKGTYSTIKTWSESKDNYYCYIKKTYNVSRGTYRLKAKVTSYTGSGSETVTKYSGAKTY